MSVIDEGAAVELTEEERASIDRIMEEAVEEFERLQRKLRSDLEEQRGKIDARTFENKTSDLTYYLARRRCESEGTAKQKQQRMKAEFQRKRRHLQRQQAEAESRMRANQVSSPLGLAATFSTALTDRSPNLFGALVFILIAGLFMTGRPAPGSPTIDLGTGNGQGGYPIAEHANLNGGGYTTAVLVLVLAAIVPVLQHHGFFGSVRHKQRRAPTPTLTPTLPAALPISSDADSAQGPEGAHTPPPEPEASQSRVLVI